MRLLFQVVVIAIGILLTPSYAVELGDRERGYEYALANCSGCHAVDREEKFSPNPNAMSFREIAVTTGMTATALIIWLQSPHSTMPNLIIPLQEADDIVAYILSLKND